MKQIISILLAIMMLIWPIGSVTFADDFISSYDANITKTFSSYDEIESAITNDVDNYIKQLNSDWKNLQAKTSTYDLYFQYFDEVADFYQRIVSDSDTLFIKLRKYGLIYVQLILNSGRNYSNQYDDMKGLYDCLYDEACDDLYDEIYNGILDDMFRYYYSGLIDKAYNNVAYSKWSDYSSNEYSNWSEATSAFYQSWSDYSSDIYNFYSDISSAIWNSNTERITKKLSDFQKSIDELEGGPVETSAALNHEKVDISSLTTYDSIEAAVDNEVAATIDSLNTEFQELKNLVNTCEKYIQNSEPVELFYDKILDETNSLYKRLNEYAIQYARIILASNRSKSDKYDDLLQINYVIYEDAAKVINKKVYDGILKEMKDYFYEGIIKDGKDSVSYSKWSNARSNEYGNWLDTRSDFYSAWLDYRSDMYRFYLDLRSAVWSAEYDEAQKKIDRFEERNAR